MGSRKRHRQRLVLSIIFFSSLASLHFAASRFSLPALLYCFLPQPASSSSGCIAIEGAPPAPTINPSSPKSSTFRLARRSCEGQLTVKTTSSKKRRLVRPATTHAQRLSDSSPSPETALPSSEQAGDDDPAYSFSETSLPQGLDAPSYIRGESIPASSLPPRLLAHGANNAFPVDDASSIASSPCASAYAELTLESDRGSDEPASGTRSTRTRSPYPLSRRAIMNGDADLPHRSSSPLKRRASSMDPEPNSVDIVDVDMSSSQTADSASGLPRAMSVDAPDPDAAAASQRKWPSVLPC